MIRFRKLAAVLLTLMLFIGCAAAEWKADINMLFPENEAPDYAEQNYNVSNAVLKQTHRIACQVTINSTAYGCEFEFAVEDEKGTDWNAVQNKLGDIVTHAAAVSGNHASSIVKVIDETIRESDPFAAAGTNVRLKHLSVSTPYYPMLSIGMAGKGAQTLQERLIVLGFLNDRADGNYGEKTVTAVKTLQEYVRMLEEEAIEVKLAETPVPTAPPTSTPTPSPTPTPVPTATPVPTHELVLIPKETREPLVEIVPTNTPEPTPTAEVMQIAQDVEKPEAQTKVDGVADALLQAYLFSWNFPTVHEEVSSGMSGKDVLRVQTRMNNLGYLAEPADGIYGESTAQAVAYFQYRSGLESNGKADFSTQKAMFSANAQKSPYTALALGASGEEVKKLQQKLSTLGFASSSADGTYGTATKTAVENLQKYLKAAGRRKAVNGIADAALLDELYSGNLDAVPGAMTKGDKGEEVTRLQRRLISLGFLKGSEDGKFGAGTASALEYFQRQHRLPQTGEADLSTLSVLFSENASKALKPYILEVSIAEQRVYAYGLDENNEYTVLERTMVCSTGKSGSDTPTGTYESTTGPGARWHYFTKFDCWAQYAYYIKGDIMFHSVLFGQKEGKVTQSSVRNLGKRASHGCVRLSVEDAQWIYTNCPTNTKVTVY